jgi:hypothetical protein
MSDLERQLEEIFAKIDEGPEDVTNSTPRPEELAKIVEGREPSSWRPIPLEGPVEDDAPPSLLAIEGTARHLLYPGSTNSIFGESESGKSLLAIVAAREVIERGGRVLWLDYEDTRRRFTSRLDSMSVPRELWSSIDYVNPVEALWSKRTNASTGAHADFVELLARGRYEFAVVDTMTGAMSVEGLDPNIGTEVEAIQRELMGRIVKDTGAAVLVLDHVTKSSDGRGRYAIGSERKLSGITGAAYAIEVTKPWSRALGGAPIHGTALLKITKDRPGYVRGEGSTLSTVASIEVTADPDGGLRLRVVDPRDTVPCPPLDLVTKIVEALRRFPGMSKSALEAEVDVKAATVRVARDWLIDQGAIVVESRGNGNYLTLNETRLRELDLA